MSQEADSFTFSLQLASVTRWGQSEPSATRRPASVNVSQGPLGASVPTACRASGASPSAGRAIATATAITATLRLETVKAAETSPQDITVRGGMKR